MEESFGKKNKLKSRKLITQLFSEGKSVNHFPLKLVYIQLREPQEVLFKAGVSVPKRNFKRAVDRNHLKRLLREAFRKNKYLLASNLTNSYAFMFIYIGKNKEEYHNLFSGVETLLKKFVEKEIK
ncbi:MAG TPA: ribonuclease P protein component [Salinimicrobium sp.]|nr:ribonuclease P protein component [Salinimicrobium sp.]